MRPEDPAVDGDAGPTVVDPTVSEGESAPADAQDADWVNGPVEDVDDEELKASAAEETAAEDWINGPTEEEATSSAAAGGRGTGAAVAGGAVSGYRCSEHERVARGRGNGE